MILKIKLKEINVFFLIYSNWIQNTKLLQKLEESLKKLHDEAADSANTKLPSLILPTNGLEVSQHESLVPAIGEEVRNRNRHSFVSYNRSSEPNTATTIDLSEDEQINYYDDEEEEEDDGGEGSRNNESELRRSEASDCERPREGDEEEEDEEASEEHEAESGGDCNDSRSSGEKNFDTDKSVSVNFDKFEGLEMELGFQHCC